MKAYNGLQGASYSKTLYAIESGAVDTEQFFEDYTRLRNAFMRNLSRIRRSDVPLRAAEPLTHIPTARQLAGASSSVLAHAVAELNIMRSNIGTVSSRRAARAANIKSLHASGYTFIDESNIDMFAGFMEWFKENKINMFLDSKDRQRVTNFLEERADAGRRGNLTSRGWARVFIQWLDANGYDEEAESLRRSLYISHKE